MCGWGGCGWGGMGGSGWLVMSLFWLVLIVVIVWAVTRLVHPAGGRGEVGPARREESPQEILDRRLASGEIDTATYDELKARLPGRRQEPQ
ncbi:hypothetical protein GCM10009872_39840 [Actinopolymorpha rutila]